LVQKLVGRTDAQEYTNNTYAYEDM